MLLKINNSRKPTTIEFSNNLAKLSIYVASLEKVGRVVPILNTTSEIFDIFEEWFDILDSVGILNNVDDINYETIFYPNFFIVEKKITDMDTLLKLYELGIFNQIGLLTRTIMYVISVLNETTQVKLINITDKIYVMDLASKKIMSGEISCKCFETELSTTEFDLITHYKDKILYNYHPSLFTNHKFIYDYRNTSGFEKYLSKDIIAKIISSKEEIFKSVFQFDSILVVPTVKTFDRVFLEEISSLNDIISKNWLVFNIHSNFTITDDISKNIINSIHITKSDIEKLVSRHHIELSSHDIKPEDGVLNIPDEIKFIQSHAFEDMKISKVIFPYSLCFIGHSAFKDCGNIILSYKDKKGVIHENEISDDIIINDDAFKGCKLEQELRNSILKINSNAVGSSDDFSW